MKTILKKWGVWVVAAVFGGVFLAVSARASADEQSFLKRRAALPSQLAALRERTDKAGGEELSLALLLASQNKDARLVASTVLVYQEYPKERKLAVLLAAAVRYSERLEVLQRVKDGVLEEALLQAPADMEGIGGMFSAVEELSSLSPSAFQKAVRAAQHKIKGLEFSRQAVQESVKRSLNQTTQADRD